MTLVSTTTDGIEVSYNGNSFTEKDLVSFGEYLLSKERAFLLKSVDSDIKYKERKRSVYHADLENWKEFVK